LDHFVALQAPSHAFISLLSKGFAAVLLKRTPLSTSYQFHTTSFSLLNHFVALQAPSQTPSSACCLKVPQRRKANSGQEMLEEKKGKTQESTLLRVRPYRGWATASKRR